MKKVLPLEYISKSDSSISREFSERACGAICVGMILKTKKKKFGNMDDLIKHGISIDAYIEEVGWSHQGLVNLMSEYSVSARLKGYKRKNRTVKKDFSLDERFEIDFIQNLKKNRQIIASVEPCFSTNNSSHLVVIHGFQIDDQNEKKVWLISDSSSTASREEWIDAEYFKDYFRGLVMITDE